MTISLVLPPQGAAAPPSGDGKGSRPRSVRRWLAIDEREPCIALAHGLVGRLLMAMTALLAAAPHFGAWETLLAISAAMAAASLPQWRGRILFMSTWAIAFLATGLGWNDTLGRVSSILQQEQVSDWSPELLASGLLMLVLLGAVWALHWVRQAPQSLLARRPLVTLLLLEVFLCALAMIDGMAGLPRTLLWSFVFVLTPYIWFLPYAIVDQRARDASPPLMQLATLRPFWSPTYLPFGKGAAFLRKHLAKTPRELAVTQLKAVKLLLWANVLYAIKLALDWLFADVLPVPSVEQALIAHLGAQPYPLLLGWAAMILSAAQFALQIAIWAHLFIGIARLAGYRLPRGSWRPLESRTLMDYFNRFHYYFKELLVDFFFVPTFFKLFRRHPRLRMFFATFMAAGVGNALWHFLRDIDLIARVGLATAMETYLSYAFYCLMLATGVGLSQVRVNMGIRPATTRLGRLYSFLFVWSFVVCLHVFSDGSRNHSLGERMSFLASLFGVN
jgi:hypothetical protein